MSRSTSSSTPSTGTARRTVPARAEVTEPRELVFDEPLHPITAAAFARGSGVDPLPETKQAAHDRWIDETGADGIIAKSGRTVDVVRAEMALWHLGLLLAAKRVSTVATLLAAPAKTQAAQGEWVGQLEEGSTIKLRGSGRTVEVIGAEIDLVVDGAKAGLSADAVAPLPEEVSQAANDTWINAHDGCDIKMRGSGRTAEVVRSEIALFAQGMRCAKARAADATRSLAALLAAPAKTQAAQSEWVGLQIGGNERGDLLKLRGTGRTVEVVGAEIDLVIGGAKQRLVSSA